MISDKVNKILVVVFLTLLIWTWAFMSIKTGDSFVGTLTVKPSTDPSLLVTLALGKSKPLTEIPLTSLNFTGAPSRISDLQNRTNHPVGHKDREQLDFYYDPQEHGSDPGQYPLDILKYLQDSSKIDDLALALNSCTPTQATVTIEKLVKKELPVQCVNKDGLPLKGANPDPAIVEIYVREKYNESATAVLTPQQIEIARKGPVEVTPYVELGIANVRREAANPVSITIKSGERLKQQPFQPTSIGFLMTPKLAGNYTVELLNETKLTERTLFNATDEAMDAYKKMRYHILIETRDGDELQPEISLRPVIYNFPPEHFKNGDIDIVEVTPAKTASFKLVPINSTPTP